MKLYKLTDENDKTYNGTQWGEGVTHTADGNGELCSEHWIHAYEHPLLAVLHNPIHGGFDNAMHMWECETTDEKPLREGYMKLGVRNLTTVRRMPVPEITIEQRIEYGIRCALVVYEAPAFVSWANDWLSGEDRSAYAAADTAHAAYAAYAAHAAYAGIDLLSIAIDVCKEK